MAMAIFKFIEFLFMGTKNTKRSLCQAGEWIVHILRDARWAALWWADFGWTPGANQATLSHVIHSLHFLSGSGEDPV